MPLGDYPLGDGPLGFDPVAPPSAPPVVQVGAPLIRPGTGDAIVQADGSLLGVHPVDQQVSLALRIALGTVGGASDEGNTLRSITHLGRDLEAVVEQKINSALARLTSRGDITLLSVTTDRNPQGFTTTVSYRNNRSGKNETATLTV